MIYIENMMKVVRVGVVIMFVFFGFYIRFKIVDDMINFIIGRILDIFGIFYELYKCWGMIYGIVG